MSPQSLPRPLEREPELELEPPEPELELEPLPFFSFPLPPVGSRDPVMVVASLDVLDFLDILLLSES